jgi:hypothetical protein
MNIAKRIYGKLRRETKYLTRDIHYHIGLDERFLKQARGSPFDQVMSKLINLAGRLGINQLHFHNSPGTPLYLLFVQHYKATHSFSIIFRDFGDRIVSDKIKFTFADIDIF